MVFKKNTLDDEPFKYRNDLQIKTIRSTITVFLTYIFILILWQYTLSFQSSMYTLMNSCVLVMFIAGTIGLILCAEERLNLLKYTKITIITYLVLVFVWDMFFKIVVINIAIGSSVGQVDTTLLVTKNVVTSISSIMKITIPAGYVGWVIKSIGLFRSRTTKKKAMENIRDVRNYNTAKDNGSQNIQDEIERY